MDDAEPTPDRERAAAAHDQGYRAGARLRESQGSRTRLTVLVLVAVVGAGVAFSALDTSPAFVGPTPPPSRDASRTPPIPAATPYPALAILGAPAPTRPVPLHTLWLRWLDPVSASLSGDVDPQIASAALDFVDAGGRTVQVCPVSGVPHQAYIPEGLDLCTMDASGAVTGRTPLMAFGRFDPGGLTNEIPVQYDATISPDGRWLWVVVAYPHPTDWVVDVVRADLSTRSLAGQRRLRTMPIGEPGAAAPSTDGWLVPAGTAIWPVVRASPSGEQLSVSLMARSGPPSEPDTLQGLERLVLDASLDDAPPTVALPRGAAIDTACDPERGAWATERDYLTVCQRSETDGTIQPFVRIEHPDDVTRDFTVGPALFGADGASTASSWLLDSQQGTLFRWAPSGLALSSLNVVEQVRTTLLLSGSAPSQSGEVVAPAGGVLGDGTIVWTPMGKVGTGQDGLQLAGTADGRILYVLGSLPGGVGGIEASGHAVVWVVDAATLGLVARWDAPGPVDQIALGPGGGPLVELVTPAVGATDSSRGPVPDWVTPLWFVDEGSGLPLEVVGQLRGPGSIAPVLLAPVAGTFAGF